MHFPDASSISIIRVNEDLVKMAVMAAAAVMMGMMMEQKLVLNTMTLPRRLTSPAEMLKHFL
jgi:hypothetical protein